MSKNNEWDPVLPRKRVPSNRPGVASAPPGPAPKLAEAIYQGLMSIKPQPPAAVHFYLGEGLRWIRVGFDGTQPLQPSAVAVVGETIERIARQGPLFFHALRPYDMLFFLEGEEADAMGMPPECFGTPLDQVLQAWGSGKPQSRARKRA